VATKCYAMVRGSAIRVTGLTKYGSPGNPLVVPDSIQFATSKSVTRVTINETVEAASNEMLRNEEDERRLHLVRKAQVIRHTVDIDFLRVDPGVLSLVAGVPLVYAAGGVDGLYGFGEGPFGEDPFGGSVIPVGDVVGFDSDTKRPAASFALEVWSKLAGQLCVDGQQQYGYTLFPYLKGGRLSGFTFQNGLVSFNLRAAQTRKVPRWGVGPYDLEGAHERLLQTVSRNSSWQTFMTPAVPPVEACGIQETEDIIEGGSAASTSSDIIDGEFVATSPWIIEGGRAR
jgi:hypothetical protein